MAIFPGNCLLQTLNYVGELPANVMEEFRKKLKPYWSEVFLVDGVERLIQRPKDSEKQKMNYSGKKKRHTTKNLVITDKEGKQVLYLSETVAGSIHDKKLFDQQQFAFPKKGIKLLGDLAFKGIDLDNVTFIVPIKKHKGIELPDFMKEANRKLASIRVRVEHAICGIKRLRILKDIFRLRREGALDRVMKIGAGLHNFRSRRRRLVNT
ncbi:transposase family protein [Limibacter armeniacum]|uniref:HARBI1 family protein n=1 Tax=Limibacter armeniacum TaxID=466084 RepID=UPI002FE683A2